MVANLFQRVRTSQETGRRTGLPGRPFIGGRAAIAEGYQDYLGEKGDGQPAPESNADKTSEPNEIPQGQGMTSTEPFGDQAGTNDWDSGGIDSESQPEKVTKNEGDTSQSEANRIRATSVEKIETSLAIPEFYQVQDQTGRVKFSSSSVEALVSTYDEITHDGGDNKLSKLTASQRDVLEIAWKLKNGRYKSIDQLSEDITLCANIEEDPTDFKANFESITKALGITADSQKMLSNLSNYNNRKLHNAETPSATDPIQKNAKAALKHFQKIREGLENNAANLSNEEIGNLSYLLNSLREAKGNKIEISKREWQLLQRVPYVYGRQTANNSEWAKDAAKFDEQEGLEEKNRIAVIDDKGILLSADYVEYIRSLFAKLTQKEIIEEQPDRLNDKISQKDIETLEAKLNEFKEIQTKGKLTDEQPDTFMALALLKEKTGWDKATYGNVPTNLLSLTEYDKQPSVSHLTKGEKINIDRLTGEEVEEVKNIIVKLSQNEDERHSKYVDDLSKIIDKINRREDFTTQEVDAARQTITSARILLKMDIGLRSSESRGEVVHGNPIEIAAGKAINAMEEEVGIAREEIAAAVPAIQNVGENTMQLALERLGVLGIEPEKIISQQTALEALGYRDPNKVLQLADQSLKDEEISVPEFLKIQNTTSTSWAERIFGKEASRSKVGGFVDKVRDWWGNKKWDRSTIETKSGTASEATTVVTAAGLILLALLGVNKLKEKGVDKPHTAEIIDREKPVSANPQTFDDVPNPYPPVFEGQTIYPEVPNVSVSEIGTDVLAQYTQVTPEMVRACQAGNNSYLINCIKAVAGSQAKELRTELVGIIGEAAKKRANSEGRDWSKLNANERNAYADAVLGGDKNSPAGKIAKKLGLDQKDYTFTGMDDLKKIGIKVALPEKPKLIPEDMVISEIKAMKI